jgi:probable rRNA maturation factor
MTRAARPALTIDVLVVSDRWASAGRLKSAVRRAVAQAGADLSTTGSELAIVLADDSTLRALNRDWRGIDAPTNVLSFPAKNAGAGYLGDVILAHETIAREARSEGKPLTHHVAHLAVHGFLHLLGYDHERQADALKMEHTERRILRRLAIPDPYRLKAEPKKPRPARRPRRHRAAARRSR